MKKLFVISAFVIQYNLILAQNYVGLQNGLNFQGKCLYSDSIDQILFTGGLFTQAGGIQATCIANWNNSSWSSFNAGVDDRNSVNSIIRFNGLIYVGGAFRTAGNKTVNGITRWNGTSWDTLFSGLHSNGSLKNFFIDDNLLYCLGAFDSAGTERSPLVAIWDGNNWSSLGVPGALIGAYSINDAVKFNNELYFGGFFTDSSNTLFDLIKWDGNIFTKVGNGFYGNILSLTIFQNEMYIAGNNFGGVPGSNIVKYDGSQFTAVGGGINGTVSKLKVIGNELYAVGNFTQAGVTPVSNIAKWNGSIWSAFSNDAFNNGISDIAVFNYDLYVIGGFTVVGSDSINYIAKYAVPMEINNMDEINSLTLFPNPNNGSFQISSPNFISNIQIVNSLGDFVDFEIQKCDNYFQIQLKNKVPGIYFINHMQNHVKCSNSFAVI